MRKLVIAFFLLLCLQPSHAQFVTFIPQISVIRQPNSSNLKKIANKTQPSASQQPLTQKSKVTSQLNSAKSRADTKAIAIVSPTPKLGKKRNLQASCFILKLDWACRSGTPFESCAGSILWNGKVIKSINPSDYAIHNTSWPLKAVIGRNTLQFRGQGTSDTFGLTIDNVKLIRHDSTFNVVVNGEFELPSTDEGFKFFNNIPGWSGEDLEIGNGKVYNPDWNSQVCELDGNRNYVLTQYFDFDCEFNTLEKSKCACINQVACSPAN